MSKLYELSTDFQNLFDMFEEMNQRIDREITFFLLKVRIRKEHEA